MDMKPRSEIIDATSVVTEVRPLAGLMEGVARTMRLPYRVRAAALTELAASMAQVIRVETEALSRERAMLLEQRSHTLYAQARLHAMQAEVNCRRQATLACALAVQDLLDQGARLMAGARDEATAAIIASMITDGVQQIKAMQW